VRALAQAYGIEGQIDWSRAEEVVNDAEGIARDVSFHSDPGWSLENPTVLGTNERMPAAFAAENLMPHSHCHDPAPRAFPIAVASEPRCTLPCEIQLTSG
jgi:hypothetical protein